MVCNSMCGKVIKFKFDHSAVQYCTIQSTKILITRQVMSYQSWKIGYLYKTLFANPVTYVCSILCKQNTLHRI